VPPIVVTRDGDYTSLREIIPIYARLYQSTRYLSVTVTSLQATEISWKKEHT